MMPEIQTQSTAPYRVTMIDLLREGSRSTAVPKVPSEVGHVQSALESDPTWLYMTYRDADAVQLLVLWQADSVAGMLPVVLRRDEPLVCRLGEATLAKLPLKRLKFVDVRPGIPGDERALDELFHTILRRLEFDAVAISGLRLDSLLSKYIETSSLVREHFTIRHLSPPMQRQLISMEDDFENYLNHWSAKTRKNRLREVKKLEEAYQVNLIAVTEPDQVASFLEYAATISKKTYQFNLLGTGIRNTAAIAEKLRWMAVNHYLRSYLLICDSTPCAFIYGYQLRDTYTYKEIGYDPAWARFNVGNVLLLKALEDAFRFWKPKYFDLGGFLKYKEMFSTFTFPESNVMLFRRALYPQLASRLFLGCAGISRAVGSLLDRCNAKSHLKNMIRQVHARPQIANPGKERSI